LSSSSPFTSTWSRRVKKIQITKAGLVAHHQHARRCPHCGRYLRLENTPSGSPWAFKAYCKRCHTDCLIKFVEGTGVSHWHLTRKCYGPAGAQGKKACHETQWDFYWLHSS
jgi:hypothetical protein